GVGGVVGWGVGGGGVVGEGLPPQATYLFKHALVRDVAYGSLLRGHRQQLHGRIADVLAEHFPTTIEAEPEVMAFHFMEARQFENAVGYWLKAGERAAQRSANLEAIRHLSRGLGALQTLPNSIQRDQWELAYQIA